jgi:hypothetical protein
LCNFNKTADKSTDFLPPFSDNTENNLPISNRQFLKGDKKSESFSESICVRVIPDNDDDDILILQHDDDDDV